MIIISDTTPLITLMKINQLELLEKMFNKIIIPEAVYKELTMNPIYKDEAKCIQSASYIKIENVKGLGEVERLIEENKLDIGESEAIVLYKEITAELLLIDEHKARKIAQSKGYNVMGTTGILVNGVYNGYLSKDECLKSKELLLKSNIRMKNSLLIALEDAAQGKFQSKIISKVKSLENSSLKKCKEERNNNEISDKIDMSSLDEVYREPLRKLILCKYEALREEFLAKILYKMVDGKKNHLPLPPQDIIKDIVDAYKKLPDFDSRCKTFVKTKEGKDFLSAIRKFK